MKTKVCFKCGEEKLVSEFSKYQKREDGLQAWCRKCAQIYHQNNREAICKRSRDWYQKNKEHASEQKKEYYQKNRKKIRERQKDWEQKNRKQWINILEEKFGEIQCKKCGYNKCFAAIDTHHLDNSTKNIAIGDFIGSHASTDENIKILFKELEKCIFLCRNCHAELHAEKERMDNEQIK